MTDCRACNGQTEVEPIPSRELFAVIHIVFVLQCPCGAYTYQDSAPPRARKYAKNNAAYKVQVPVARFKPFPNLLHAQFL